MPPLPSLTQCRTRASWSGPDTLGDDELLALILDPVEPRPLTRARHLLEAWGGLTALHRFRAPLLESAGLTEEEAHRLCAAIELGQRALRDQLLPDPEDPLNQALVESWARPRLAGLDHEEVWVLCVTPRSRLKSSYMVGRGGLHGCGLLPRDILQPVVRDGASGFVLVHNHPSGDPRPSPEDIDLTRGLQLAAASVGVPLLDHVIVGREGSSSLLSLGFLDD